MNKEIQYIISSLQRILDGQPWYGRPVLSVLEEIDPVRALAAAGRGMEMKSGHHTVELFPLDIEAGRLVFWVEV